MLSVDFEEILKVELVIKKSPLSRFMICQMNTQDYDIMVFRAIFLPRKTL